MAREPHGVDYVFCPHCATKNPKSAFVCLKCFKVMFPQPPSGLFAAQIPTSVSVAVIFATLVLAGIYLGNRWLSSIEANLTLNIKTSDYNVNVTADKRKNSETNKKVTIQPNKEEPVTAGNEE